MVASSRSKNIKGLFKDVRTRTIIVLTSILVVFVVFVGITGFLKSKRSAPASDASTSSIPKMKSVPGIKPTTQQFADLQKKQNVKHYKEAQSQGSSSIPTIITTDDEVRGSQSGNVGSDASSLSGTTGSLGRRSEKGQQGKNPVAVNVKPVRTANNPNNPAPTIDAKGISSQAKRLISTWGKTNKMVVVASSISDEVYATQQVQTAQQQSTGNGGQGEDEASQLKPLYKAGDIIFAVLSTTVNSDYPGPVLATVVSGPLKGSKLIGAVSQGPTLAGTEGPESVMLKFTQINVPGKPTTASMNSVAIDPDTAYTVLADNVDHHYLLRYGTLFASSFLEGVGDAVQQAGSISTTNVFGGETTTNAALGTADEIIVGLGEVGSTLGEQIDGYFDRPPTVYVYAGTSMGILMLSDLTIDVTK